MKGGRSVESASIYSHAYSIPSGTEGCDKYSASDKNAVSQREKQSSNDSNEDSKDAPDDLKPVSLFRLFRFAAKFDMVLILAGSFFSICTGASTPILIILYSNLMGVLYKYQRLYNDGSVSEANHILDHESRKYCKWFVILGVITWVVSYGFNACWAIAAENQGMRIRKLYYSSIMRQEIGWIDKVRTGELSTRIINDINLIQEGLSEKLGLIVTNISAFSASLIIALVRGWDIALVCLCAIPFIIVFGGYFESLSAKYVMFSKNKAAESSAVADEALSSIRTIMSFNGQEREIKRYNEKVDEAYKLGKKNSLALGISSGCVDFFIYVMYCIGFHYGGWRVYNGKYESQDVLNVTMILLTGGLVLASTAPNITIITTARGCAAKVFDTIDRASAIDPTNTQDGKKAGQLCGEISFHNIHFCYPSRPNVKILKGFNLNINAGQKVALVGESGCGKSTTISLIERFYDPEEGEVLIDGVDIKEYNIGTLRDRIGIVTQEPVLFSTTVFQNITWGAVDPENNPPTEEEVIDACRAANAHQFISQLPDGYQTLVGEGGALLSGGQKQRIAIARAIIRNPDILLLDEATSALDTASERLVQDALDKLSLNRTTISIAHRLSTIRNSDQIYVVRDGIVSEHGTHDELVSMDGEYASMVRAQELRQTVRSDNNKSVDKEADLDELIVKELQEQALDLNTTTHQMRGSLHSESKLLNKDKNHKSINDSSDMKLLFRLIWSRRSSLRAVIPGICFAAVEGSVLPLFGYAYSRSLIELSNPDLDRMRKQVTLYANIFLAFSGTVMFSIGGRMGMFNTAGESMARRLRQDMFSSYMRFEAGYFDSEQNSVGTLTARLSSSTEDITKIVNIVFGTFVSALSTVICGVVIAFVYDWRLSLIILVCWPILGGSQYLQARVAWHSAAKTREAYDKLGQSASEIIRNIKTVATLHREEMFIRNFVTDIMKPYEANVKGILYSSVGYGFAQPCNLFVNAIIFFAGCQFIIKEWSTVEKMSNSMMVLMMGSLIINHFGSMVSFIGKGAVASRGISEIINRESSIDGLDPIGDVPEKSFEGNVDFENVKFSYPIRPDTKILKGISFKALAGKSVALVGASGSGKSTSILLTQRLYDVNSGKVNVEGLGVRDWNITALRDNMAIVGQEPVLFNYSIAENIRYGKPDATQKEVEDAAKEANAYNFVTEFPDGFDTSVGQRGGRLSGGQKQRIAIARALIRKPKLLLLDEATAALDSRSEKIVQRVLDKASKERTTLTVAHRLSTIQDCDMIVVFKNGRIVECGTHDELISMKGAYSSLVEQQQLQVTH